MNTNDLRRKRLGSYLTHLRHAQGLSRPKVLTRVAQLLDDDDPLWDVLSEVWLKHIEHGTRVDVSRHMLDTLCRALDCSNVEAARVLWYADRNMTVDGASDPTDMAIMLNVVLAWLHTEAHTVVQSLLHDAHLQQLTEREMLLIVAKTIQVVLDDVGTPRTE